MMAQPQGQVEGGKLDIGAVKDVYIEVEAIGRTLQEAIDNAIRLAVEQVNGKDVAIQQAQASYTSTIRIGDKNLNIAADALSSYALSVSGGSVSSFKLLEQKESSNFWSKSEEEEWTVRVGANVTQYQQSQSSARPRITVASPRASEATYRVGGIRINAGDIKQQIRSALSQKLQQTNRFSVLDREFSKEVNEELDFIESGRVNRRDMLRVGQMLATDLLVVPSIKRFEYARLERQLRTSDRMLVSYSGGGTLEFRVINVASGEIFVVDTVSEELPDLGPSTMGLEVNAEGKIADLAEGLTSQAVRKILMRTFPISVISIQGDTVVLNQGGQSVELGERYQAVFLGDEITDPQTGQSLGAIETPCCNFEIIRVATGMSYGRVIDNDFEVPQNFKPGSIRLTSLLHNRDSVSAPTDQNRTESPTRIAPPEPKPRDTQANAPIVPPPEQDEDW